MNLKVVNKKVYVVSDIHNDADRFKLLLEKIDFAEDDILILAEIFLIEGISRVNCILKS